MAPRRSTGHLTAVVLLAAGSLVAAWQSPVQAAPLPLEVLEGDRSATEPTRPARPVTLRARLLPAAGLPAAGAGSDWTVHRTASREPENLVGTCHRSSMYSVGAMRVAHRSYRADDASGSRADHLVASFADPVTAWRAFQVLRSWHRSCDQLLGDYDRYSVGSLRAVKVPVGEAHRFELSYGPSVQAPETDVRDGEGLVLVGNRIAVLRLTCPATLPAPRRDPVAGAVRDAAALLA